MYTGSSLVFAFASSDSEPLAENLWYLTQTVANFASLNLQPLRVTVSEDNAVK